MAHYILALDLGTTGNRALVFDQQGKVVHQAYKELTQYYPQPGWLEHDAREIWLDTCWALQTVLTEADIDPRDVAALGLTVQRETCVLWHRQTGQPLRRAIVWQDRRTAPRCRELVAAGKAEYVQATTGLVVDAYFSATKLEWLWQHVRTEHPQVAPEDIMAGTIDAWILWNLTGHKVHATDHSNASRTMLLNLEHGKWDPALLAMFGIPAHVMPAVKPSIGYFGALDPAICGAAIPITAVLGDQQAALLAHGCDRPGLSKCTYGTGCFLVSHTGESISRSRHQLLSTVAWSASDSMGYALEGSMFTAGACIQWLRDKLQVVDTAAATAAIATSVADSNGVVFVPALSGLGAPHWDMSARGAFMGITGGCERAHMIRAVLEAIAYQVCEIVVAIGKDDGQPVSVLKVDGGACRNDFLMQFQADALGIPVERPALSDATAEGAAFAAGLGSGFWHDYGALVAARPVDRVFAPGMGAQQAQAGFDRWQLAVSRCKDWPEI